MAIFLWGKVYFHNDFAGILREEPGNRFAFEYDKAYLEKVLPRIAHTLPSREEPYYSHGVLHPFFDNLVAEGWLLNAQARAIRVSPSERFKILLAFGRDCIGAVSVVDPDAAEELKLADLEEGEITFLSSRASLSGVQRKLNVVFRNSEFWPAKKNENGTHIAKLVSGDLRDLIELEYLSTLAAKTLLPRDKIVEPKIALVKTIRESAFIVQRFDRAPDGRKIHFEEFSQLLGIPSGDAKYDAAYDDIANFIRTTPGCVPAEIEILFRRILVCFLIGNTDAHLKNFALFSEPNSLRLTPSYDMVGSALYPEFDQIALAIGQTNNLFIRKLQAKHVVLLGKNFGLAPEIVDLAVQDLKRRMERAKDAVAESGIGTQLLRDNLIEFMEKRWNGTFSSIGKALSKRQ